MSSTVMKELKQEFEIIINPVSIGAEKNKEYIVAIIKAEYNIDDGNGEAIPAGRWYLTFDPDDPEINIWTRVPEKGGIPVAAVLPVETANKLREFLPGDDRILAREIFWRFFIPALKAVKS